MSEQGTEWDEVFQLISWWDSARVKAARVLVVGAGALGNEVLKNLALLNAGHVFIVDFDRIEYTNLSRSVLFRESDVGRIKSEVAAERIREINPNIRVEWMDGDVIYDLGLGFIRSVDVIIGCLDNRVARLYVNRYAHRFGKTWINAGILNLAGMLDVFRPGVSCYECSLADKDWDQIRKRLGCTDIAKRNASVGRLPTTPISASILGAMQVQEAFKVIYNNEAALLDDKRYFYDGQANESLYYPSKPLKPGCESHGRWEDIKSAPKLTSQSTVAQMLGWARNEFQDPKAAILLDYDIVTELYGKESDISTRVLLPRFRITDEVYKAHQSIVGELVMIPAEAMINRIDENFAHPEAKLADLGVPPWQILQIEAGEDIQLVSLDGDADLYFSETKKMDEPASTLKKPT